MQKGRRRNKWFQAGGSAAIMQSMARKSRRSFMRQHHITLTAAVLLSLIAAGCSKEGVSPGEVSGNVARAALVGADQTPHGEVIVAQGDDGLLVNINAQGMTPGPHGVHIHETGKCEGPDFKSAGGHWNPAAKQHGFDNPQGAHAGDFFNLDIGADGTGALEATISGAKLSDGNTALLDADGAAFVVHAGPDDLKTDPSGESGGRIACGTFVRGR
jgi:Cu-Zn family superoxide dismutase